MARLTSYDPGNDEILVNEEERLLSSQGYYDKDAMYKIMRHLAEKLYEYEQKEEDGFLISIPCKPGDTVYTIRYARTSCSSNGYERGDICCRGCTHTCDSKEYLKISEEIAPSYDWIIRKIVNKDNNQFLAFATLDEAKSVLAEANEERRQRGEFYRNYGE